MTEERSYPLPMSVTDDSRFTVSLLVDVRDVLAAHGFPKVQSGVDLLYLEKSLCEFLYAPTTTNETTPGGTGPVTGEEC